MFTDVSVEMPDILDLTMLRGTGLQPGEEELPENVQGLCHITHTLLFTSHLCLGNMKVDVAALGSV